MIEDFDGKKFLDLLILAKTKANDLQAYKILKVFQKHNISVMEATQILVELQFAVTEE